MAAADDSHLWLRGPSAVAGYSHYVAAVSNRRWPLASAKPQVAVCGFFGSMDQAAAYAAAHQRYKQGQPGIPDGPIFLALECGRLFPLALSPRRLFGDQSAAAAKKRDALLRNYYRKREVERQEVAARKLKDERDQKAGADAAAAAATPAIADARSQRTATRRARRHAWELLQRLRAQKERLARASAFLAQSRNAAAGSGGGSGSGSGSGSGEGSAVEMDDEMADFLESLTEAQREALANPADAAAAATATPKEDDGEPAVEEVVPRTEINPAPKTRVGTLDEYIAWAERHFAKQGIEPASDEMMDREEREREAAAVVGAAGAAAVVGAAGAAAGSAAGSAAGPAGSASAPPASHRLPSPPEGQAFCVGTLFFDDAGPRVNKDCPEAAGLEHVVTFFEPAASAEAAKELTEKSYAQAFKDERLFFVRTGVWCCFDNVTDDDGLQLYREDMMAEMFAGSAENHMLKFVEKALEQRPDMLPIPTAE
jgi:hypothetical protein